MTGVLVVGRVRVVITVTISPASASGRFAGPRWLRMMVLVLAVRLRGRGSMVW